MLAVAHTQHTNKLYLCTQICDCVTAQKKGGLFVLCCVGVLCGVLVDAAAARTFAKGVAGS